MVEEKVIVIDFGGQYNQLVARRVRECNVYCEIYSYKTPIDQIKAMNPKGIILTGGPNSCYEEGAPTYTKELFELGIPVLGLCYGAQLMQLILGGNVEHAPVREYGKIEVIVDGSKDKLFKDIDEKTIVWMSHNDYISKVAPGFEIIAHTADCPVAAAACEEKKLYAIQFHPEVLHTVQGKEILFNFVRNICETAGTWKMDSFVENTIKEVREKVKDGKVLLALSGGVDSSVAAALYKEKGYNVIGVTLHMKDKDDEREEIKACCGPDEQTRARMVCEKLGIEHHFVSAKEDFAEKVLKYTWSEYCIGRTPNPCVMCNHFIKFGPVMQQLCEKFGAEGIITGHYAVIDRSDPQKARLFKGENKAKDQTYFLSALTQEQLNLCHMPLGDIDKEQVRSIAEKLGLPTAKAKESQDTCFGYKDEIFAETLAIG